MNITTSIRDDVATLALRGRFDFSTLQAYRDQLKDALSDITVGQVQIDLGNVDYLDSSALGALLISRDQAKAAGKTITLARPGGFVKKALDAANFQKLFTY